MSEIPFSNNDLERALLGQLLGLSQEKDDDTARRTLSIVRARDFFHTNNRVIFAAILALDKDGLHFGVEAVATLLHERRKLTDTLTREDLEQIVRDGARFLPLAPEDQARQVRAMGERRDLHAAWKRMGEDILATSSPSRARAMVQEKLTALNQSGYQQGLAGESADALLRREFPPRVEIVPPLLAAGECVLVVAPPKTGKSILILQMALAIASGSPAMGTIPVLRPRPVLYLCLDDGAYRTQYRLKRMLDGMDIPAPRGLTFHYTWPRFDQGGLGMIEGWADSNPGGVVFIDILENVRPERGASIYKGDYDALRPLSDLAHRTRIASAVVHHTNRRGAKGVEVLPFETISGSEGLAGSVDGAIIFGRRQQNDPSVKIDVGGRDIAPGSYTLTWDEFLSGWRFDGESLQSKITARISPERQAVLDAIQQAGRPLRPSEIADRLGRPPVAVRQFLFVMKNAEQIVAYEDGTYQHPAEHARQGEPPTTDAD